MAKKVKFKIPKEQKITLKEPTYIEDEYESLEEYENEKIKLKSTIPLLSKKTKRSTFFVNTFFVLLFITITTFLLSNILSNLNNSPKKEKNETKEPQQLSNNITGKWQSSTNGLFLFNKDATFYWFNSYENIQDDYYKGEYNYKTGLDALNEMGYSEQDFINEYGTDIKIENVYSINLKPSYALMSGIDMTSVKLNQNETWWFLLIVKENGTAHGYNQTLDLKYNLIKKAD